LIFKFDLIQFKLYRKFEIKNLKKIYIKNSGYVIFSLFRIEIYIRRINLSNSSGKICIDFYIFYFIIFEDYRNIYREWVIGSDVIYIFYSKGINVLIYICVHMWHYTHYMCVVCVCMCVYVYVLTAIYYWSCKLYSIHTHTHFCTFLLYWLFWKKN